MLVIGTFRKGIKEGLESLLIDYKDKFSIRLLDAKLGISNIEEDELNDLDTLITTSLTEEELMKLPKLRNIIVPKTGLDDIDESIVDNDFITILNSHNSAPYIAERALGLLMTLAGRIGVFDSRLKKGKWNIKGDSNTWTTLRNKKVGIYGYGHIGKEFEKMIRPFTSDLYTINRHKDYPSNLKLLEDINELTKVCDIVLVAVPGNSSTENTIGANELANLDGGLLVNVGRGRVIHEKSLFEALESGKLLGYASDVWFKYPEESFELCHPSSYELNKFENVVMTPHNAWNHDDKKGLGLEEMSKQVKSLISK